MIIIISHIYIYIICLYIYIHECMYINTYLKQLFAGQGHIAFFGRVDPFFLSPPSTSCLADAEVWYHQSKGSSKEFMWRKAHEASLGVSGDDWRRLKDVGDFPKSGYPIAGWFRREHPRITWMMTGGVPYFRTPI